ncbi:MAG: hypothetical protein H7267_14205 [Sandarakinorhabdus sp.]|nr:hypothetical protein [Sandarakinorhabdus sp.]
MARMKFLVSSILAAASGLAACSPSPLYVDRARTGTYGEVPRDGRGEPIWSEIRPAAAPLPVPMPGAANPG